MDENSTYTTLLIRYLDGELQGTELEEVKQLLANNAAVQAELANLQAAREAVKLHGLQLDVKRLHAEMMQELAVEQAPVKATGKVYSLLKRAVAVAAVLVVAAGIILFYQYQRVSADKLFQEQYEPYVLHESRGEASASSPAALYKAGKYAALLNGFGSLPQPTPEDRFLAGCAALEEKQPALAVQYFEQLRQQNAAQQTHLFEDDTDYYLAMAYLQYEKPAQALPLLKKVHADKEHPYHAKVSSWLLRKTGWLVNKK